MDTSPLSRLYLQDLGCLTDLPQSRRRLRDCIPQSHPLYVSTQGTSLTPTCFHLLTLFAVLTSP